MNCYVNKIDLQKPYQIPTGYDYALLYMIGGIILCRTEELSSIDWEECQEARFFSEDKELHIFEGEDGMQEAFVQDTEEDIILIREYELDNNRFHNVGKTVLVQEYLEYDSEGQVLVKRTRLRGICNGEYAEHKYRQACRNDDGKQNEKK